MIFTIYYIGIISIAKVILSLVVVSEMSRILRVFNSSGG